MPVRCNRRGRLSCTKQVLGVCLSSDSQILSLVAGVAIIGNGTVWAHVKHPNSKPEVEQFSHHHQCALSPSPKSESGGAGSGTGTTGVPDTGGKLRG
uniref:Uncharacterized protein n=1 Tax=Oryza rufipogon TaxID=4529 RepID=A0A679BBA3_ORYRU|nr:hypothetical protein [Oryza rufipogon]BBF89975.1 hypothetical protein [Oryza rufipogon]